MSIHLCLLNLTLSFGVKMKLKWLVTKIKEGQVILILIVKLPSILT